MAKSYPCHPLKVNGASIYLIVKVHMPLVCHQNQQNKVMSLSPCNRQIQREPVMPSSMPPVLEYALGLIPIIAYFYFSRFLQKREFKCHIEESMTDDLILLNSIVHHSILEMIYKERVCLNQVTNLVNSPNLIYVMAILGASPIELDKFG